MKKKIIYDITNLNLQLSISTSNFYVILELGDFLRRGAISISFVKGKFTFRNGCTQWEGDRSMLQLSIPFLFFLLCY